MPICRRPAIVPIFELLEPRLLLNADPLAGPLAAQSQETDAGRVVIYVTVPSQESGGVFTAGGVYRSTDRGETWQWAMGTGINTAIGSHPFGNSDIDQYWFLDQAEGSPDVIYVTNKGTGYDPPYHYTVYRSTDAGATWSDVFFNDPRFPENNTQVGWLFYAMSRGWGGDALGFAVNPGNSNEALYSNAGEIFITTDAGQSWTQAYTERAPGQPAPTAATPGRWTSIGLEDTSSWYYQVDPHDPNRTYICYTDIGLARSTDAGATWYSANSGLEWRNTVYQLAFDPDVPGRMWAAASNQHDIPQWSSIVGPVAGGGVAVSNDYGQTWTSLHTGLPNAPVTTIVVDPNSPLAARTLYAGVYGYGVYKSTDSGQSWTNMSSGIDPVLNRQVYSIKRAADGTLYASVAGRRPGNGVAQPLLGGLFKSTDGAQTWTRISSDAMFRPCEFAVNPVDPRIIYVAAMGGYGYSGGLFKTVDGGANWTLIQPAFDPSVSDYFEAFSVALNPANPDIVYLSSNTHGLFLSRDAGATWDHVSIQDSPPFQGVQRIAWDPLDSGSVYITTFGGGVWKGPDPAFPNPDNPALDPYAEQQANWAPLGLGAGGALFYPAASPHDSNLLFVSSDMGGMYRSQDGGASWQMLDWRNCPQSAAPVFHPTDPNIIYVTPFQGYGDKLRMSSDRGLTWSVVGGPNPVWSGDSLLSLAIDAGNPSLMLLSGANGLYRTADAGATWARVPNAPASLIGIYFDQTSPAASRVVLAADANSPYRSDDGGLTWTLKANGLPATGIRSFSGGSDPVPSVVDVQINGGAVQRSTIFSLSVRFSEDVSASLALGDLALYNSTTQSFANLSAAGFSWDPSSLTATWNLAGVSLANGRYTATLSASGVTDATGHRLDGNANGLGGDDLVFSFSRVLCDANGDARVDGADLALWQQNFDPLKLKLNDPGKGDWNNDGRVDGTDLALWQQNYSPLGLSEVAPPADTAPVEFSSAPISAPLPQDAPLATPPVQSVALAPSAQPISSYQFSSRQLAGKRFDRVEDLLSQTPSLPVSSVAPPISLALVPGPASHPVEVQSPSLLHRVSVHHRATPSRNLPAFHVVDLLALPDLTAPLES